MSLTVIDFLKRGVATSRQIQQATGLSQAAVSRHLNRLGSSVIKLNDKRPPQYVLSTNAFGMSNTIPLSMIDENAEVTIVGYLRPLESDGFYLETSTNTPSALLGINHGFFSYLPYYLDDLRPQGFLGRQIAKKMSELSEYFPSKLAYWNADQVGRYIIANNEDLTGNILLGEQALLNIKKPPKAVHRTEYARIATEVLQGETFGSSAGGEQPKFTAFNHELQKHVIVKFSPAGDSEIAQRWRDILLTEHYACLALNKYKIPAAITKIVEQGDRLFLESVRFDRKGMFGKLAMISLHAIDSEFVGFADNWLQTCNQLVKLKLFNPEDLEQIKLLSAFGLLINNTDMHLGNLSLTIDGDIFKPLPIYDMCSMGFAPKASEVMPFVFKPPKIDTLGLNSNQISVIKKVVGCFWKKLSQDKRISTEFKWALNNKN